MKRNTGRIVKKVLIAGLALLCAGVCAAAFLFFYFSKDLPTIEQITSREVPQSTKIFDRTGKILLYEISAGQERTVVAFEKIPKYLKEATISIEDEKFYEEPAFDWKGILRALIVNLRHGQIRQGGSTITQQLAKNAFLTAEQTIPRKIKEIILATKINQYYSKDQILWLYLNEIPYGPTIYGVEAASQAFFDKPVEELNVAQSAVLAALPKAPSYYSPWGSHVKELLNRQQLILEKTFEENRITEKEYEEAKKFPIAFSSRGKELKAPHFIMEVQEYLVQKYGEDLVRKGGLRVTTTLNWELQQAAEKAVWEGARRNEELYGGKNAALAAQDPRTGQILALVGSRDYFETENDGNFNVATQGLRQPGSALKPFVYLTAFEKGLNPNTVLFDVPTEFASQNPLCPPIPDYTNEEKECFHPQNYSGKFQGPIAIRDALAQSINIPAVKALYIAGVRNVVEKASIFGLTTLSNPDIYGLSLVLGGGAVRLIDVVQAYSVLAQDGAQHKQAMILEVRDSNDRVLEAYKDDSRQITDPQAVRLVNSVLSDVDARRNLFGAGVSLTTFPGYDVALKTGTSNDYRDAWAIGYTPSIVAGVWAGSNDNSPMHKHGSSILAAIPIWNAFMAEAIKTVPQDTFTKPSPAVAAKPILNGDYLNNRQIHSILFYIDKDNPAGPSPLIPESDPQFINWETGVLSWAQNNLSDFASYNQSTTEPFANGSVPVIEIKSPAPGHFVGNFIGLQTNVTSQNPIARIRVYWNGTLLDELTAQGTTLSFVKEYPRPSDVKPQNLLEVEVVDQTNSTGRASLIVYGN